MSKEKSILIIRDFIIKLLVIAVIAYIVFTKVFVFTVQSGQGMYPRIMDGDLLLTYSMDKEISIGDVVVFKRDGKKYTGRIVAQSGDTVDFSEEGELLINGGVQSEEIFYQTFISDDLKSNYPMTVPDGSYYLLGDFRTNTVDSRVYGTVDKKELIGTVINVLRRRTI